MVRKRADLQVGVEEAVGSTTNSLKIEDRTLRLCCENAAVIRYVMLANPSNKRIVETVLGAVSHIKAWRTRAVKECKDTEGTKAWLTDMASTGVMEHINEGLQVLSDTEVMPSMRFVWLWIPRS